MHRSKSNERQISTFSASNILNELADALTTIRREDELTFSDLAAVLGTSDDQASKYCAGSTAMNVVTYARAKKEWHSRFTGGLDRLCENARKGADGDRTCQSKVLKAALALSIALEDDGEIHPEEVRANRATIENARDALEELLRKLVRAA